MTSTAIPMRLAVISGDQPHHRFLVWLLREHGFDVTLWISQPIGTVHRQALVDGRWGDWTATAYHRVRRRLGGAARYRERAFRLPPRASILEPMEVASVNGPRCHALLRSAAPRLTVLVGCGKLSAHTLSLCGSAVLNVHGGCLPRYRGNHCIFFALDTGDYGEIGATIHYVDVGLDTGDIIDVVRVEVTLDDTAESLYCRAEFGAFERLCVRLTEFAEGRRLPRQPQRQGRIFQTSDRGPWCDLRHHFRRRK